MEANRAALLGSVKGAWSQAVRSVQEAEREAERLVKRLGVMAQEAPDEVKRLAQCAGRQLTDGAQRLEQSLDRELTRAAARLRPPRREDLNQLRNRLTRLRERIEALGTGPRH